MKNPKHKESTTVIAVRLPQSLLDMLPVDQGSRSRYVRGLIRQDVVKRFQSVSEGRTASTPSPPTRDGVRSLEERLNAIREVEEEMRVCSERLSTQLADLESYLRRTRRPDTGLPMTPQNAPVVALSVDPFSALPDPDRPGKVRLKSNQDGSAQFEVVHPDTPSPLPAPQPMARSIVPRTRPEDL